MRLGSVCLVLTALLMLAGCADSPAVRSAPAQKPVVPAVPCLVQADDGLYTTCLRIELDEVWSAEFQATKREYTSPKLTVGRDAPPARGRGGDLVEDRAYFNSQSGIHFPDRYLNDVRAAHRSRAHIVLAFTMSHEVGHHVQFSLRPRTRAPRADIELQADCYAGFWAGREARAGRLVIEEFRSGAMAELARLSRDAEEVSSHGTLEQRVASVDKGLHAGDPAACDIGRLTWV